MCVRSSLTVLAPLTLLATIAVARPDDKPQPAGPSGDVVFIGAAGGPMGMGQRKILKQFDKNNDGWLNQEERQAARKFLKENPPSRGGPGAMAALGPGSFLMQPILDAADVDKDGKLTLEEVASGLKKLFAACDTDKTDALSEKQLTDGLSRILPKRPVFLAAGGAAGPVPAPGSQPPGKGGAPPPAAPAGGQFVTFAPPRPDAHLATEIMKRADANKDGKLTLEELAKAGASLFKEADKNSEGNIDEQELLRGLGLLMPMPRITMPAGHVGTEPGKPGPRVSPADAKSYPGAELYDPTALRTLFLEFEDKDWEAELAEFHGTDVEVPATLTVDGKKYPNVGLRFRGMSSYGGVQAGSKRSFNVSVDYVESKQRLLGYKTLNLLNGHEDPSFLHSALYSHVARQYLPAPKANLVKVVINGESWGIYTNVQQFDKVLAKEGFKDDKGARWKSTAGGGALDYLGDKIEDYKRRYQIKSADNEKDWKALADLCRVLNQTPPDQLEAALKPILDVDGVLRFLALDVALVNGDGYWTRGSDYSLYRDGKGVFHVVPHDMNEAFGPAMGGMVFVTTTVGPGGRPGVPGAVPPPPGPGRPPGFGMPGGSSGVELDPLVGLDDARKPLRSKLLAVPAFKTRYLQYVRAIAQDALDWNKLGPVVEQYRKLIDAEVQADTRKLSSYDAFKKAVDPNPPAEAGQPAPHGGMNLKTFANRRREYLLNHAEIKKLGAAGAGE